MCWVILGDVLSGAANVAAITTGVVALVVGGRYLKRGRTRRLLLESYLKEEKSRDRTGEGPFSMGRRSVTHLMGHLAMTEGQVLEAAFGSSKVASHVATDPVTGRADALFFEHADDAID